MNYTPSVNIEIGIDDSFQYIVTPNAKSVLGNIVSSYQSGIHSFTIIGTYGTGKSSFLMALERDFKSGTKHLIPNKDVFGDAKSFKFLNITGDFAPLSKLLSERLSTLSYKDKNIFCALDKYVESIGEDGFLFIMIDEFGKVLEHAANFNPEQELYFLQKLAEYVNNPEKRIILLSTLHQNFGAYAYKLTDTQRQEWMKVKGRFKDIVFNEPVEQLLYLASEQISRKRQQILDPDAFISLFKDAKESKFISESFLLATSKKLYPLDPFAATCLTLAIQRYGQNERTLFSFLTAKGEGSLQEFNVTENTLFSLNEVFDYTTYNFYSYLSEVNADSLAWGVIKSTIAKVESGIVKESNISDSVKLIKAIGLMNIFGGSGVRISKEMMIEYAEKAMGIKSAKPLLEKLESLKVIRYANYKSQYILFEGTDIDIEDELYKASAIVPMPILTKDMISSYVNLPAELAVASYYKKGTPRMFTFMVENEPRKVVPEGEIDGIIFLVFPLDKNTEDDVIAYSKENDEANIYVVFHNTEDIRKHLHEIRKLNYLIDNIVLEDRVAKREVSNMLAYETRMVNAAVNESLMSDNDIVSWYYKGEQVSVRKKADYKKLLSRVCDEVYWATPKMRNELFNKQRVSSSIALARVNFHNAMISKSECDDLGFDKASFPPEKTIYYSLLKNTGIHYQLPDGTYSYGSPQSDDLKFLWEECERFLESTKEKPHRIGELIKTLQSKPFKLRQGFLDFWIPVFLIVKQQDFALYNENGVFVLNITKEVLELLQKKPNGFSIKAYDTSGMRIDIFKKYRQFLHKDDTVSLGSGSFVETFKPYIQFFNSLNEYAKNTRKFDIPATEHFRQILADAKDPEKAFFIDLPEALGYKADAVEGSTEDYLNLIKSSVHELVVCYDNFIDRIESVVIAKLGLPKSFEEYKLMLDEKYASVKRYLLPPKCRTFYERLMTPAETKKEFYERICNVILDKKLELTKDKEEEYLIDTLVYYFKELDRYVNVSNMKADLAKDEVFCIDVATNVNGSKQFTGRLLADQKSKAEAMIKEIKGILEEDKELSVPVLLKMLSEETK